MTTSTGAGSGGSGRGRALLRVAVAAALLATPAMLGDESVPAWMAACRDIADDTTRLACYDSIPLRASDEAPSTAVAPAPVEPGTPVPTQPPAPPASAAEAPAVAETAETRTESRGLLRRLFGRDREVSREQSRERARESDALNAIEGRVTEVVELAYDRHRITLDDGQVWTETETRRRARYAVGDTVAISRGAFGSFNLVSERTGHRVKVRRLR